MKTPFKFLDSFTKEDREIFFGREKEIEELYRRVFRSKIMLVYGVSGTGKSSLINCGLANKFRNEDWLPLNIRRGKNMPESMYAAIVVASLTPKSQYSASDTQFKKYVKSLYLDHYKPIFFIFDQFEELFIFGSKEEKSLFVSIIKTLVDSDIQCRFIFVMREEYMASVTEFEKNIPIFFSNRVRIENMDINNAIQAIKGPCKVFNISIEDGFPEALIENLSPGSPDIELTYLQVYLDKIFRIANDSGDGISSGEVVAFTLDQLKKVGNVSDLLGTFLNEQISLLDDPDSALAVLKSFVSVKGTKRQMSIDDVMEYAQTLGKPIRETVLLEMLQNFVNLRILRDKDQHERYELRHDSLATKIFEKISGVERDILEIRQFIEDGYNNWQKRGVLLSANDLEYIAPYESRLFLSSDHLNYINQSKNQLEKIKSKRRAIFAGATFVLLIVFAGFTIWALIERKTAESQKLLAIDKENESNSNLYASYSFNQLEKNSTLSYRLAEKALEIKSDNISAIKAVLNSYYSEPFYSVVAQFNNELNILKLSPDNKYIISVPSRSDNINIYDLGLNRIKDFESKDGSTVDVAFSPDENFFVTSGQDTTIRLFDINGNLIAKVENTERYNPSAFSCDSKMIATIIQDSIKIWDLKGNTQKNLRLKNSTASSVAFSCDGKYLVNGCNESIVIYDLARGTSRIIPGHKSTHISVKTSSDNNYFLSSGYTNDLYDSSNDSTVVLWNFKGEKVRSFKENCSISFTSFSPVKNNIVIADMEGILKIYSINGKLLITVKTNQIGIDQIQLTRDESFAYTVSTSSGNILMWDLRNKLPARVQAHKNQITSIEYSPDGKHILTSSYDSTAIIWNNEGKIIKVLKGHHDLVNSAQFSPDSRYVVTAGNDNSAIVWDLEGNQILNYKFDEYPVEFASFSPDNKTIAIISPANICRIIDLNGTTIKDLRWKVDYSWNVGFGSWWPRKLLLDSLGNEIRYETWHKQYINSASFSRDRKFVITASDDSTAKVWDLKGNEIICLKGHNNKVIDATFSGDGNIIVTATIDNTLRIWSRTGKLLKVITGPKEFIRYAIISPDSKNIETQSLQDTCRIYDMEGKLIIKGRWFRFYLSSVYFSPDSKNILTASRDGSAKLWDIKGKNFVELDESAVASFSSDGIYIATTTEGDHVTIWDRYGNRLQPFPDQDDLINSVKFSPDGKLILTACEDNTAKLWDLKGNEIQSFHGSGKGVKYASFSPDGKHIALANEDNTIQILLVDPVEIIKKVNSNPEFMNIWKLNLETKKKFNIELNHYEHRLENAKLSLLRANSESDTLKKIKYLNDAINIYMYVFNNVSDSLTPVELVNIRNDFSNTYKELSLVALYNRDFGNAIEYCRLGLNIYPVNGRLKVCQAISLLFNNQFEKAKEIIINLKGKPIESGNESYNVFILSTINELERKGISHVDLLRLRNIIKN
jgi:WD40 repeat protein